MAFLCFDHATVIAFALNIYLFASQSLTNTLIISVWFITVCVEMSDVPR